jgi:hypothetical protein
MDRYSYSDLRSLRKIPSHVLASTPAHVVPFGPKGGGQWTGHLIGLFIAIGFVVMALVGVPEARPFFIGSLGCGAILGCALWFWHRSKSPF